MTISDSGRGKNRTFVKWNIEQKVKATPQYENATNSLRILLTKPTTINISPNHISDLTSVRKKNCIDNSDIDIRDIHKSYSAKINLYRWL